MLAVLSFLLVRPFLLAIALGALLAYMAYPVYKFLVKVIRNKTVSSLLVCLLVLAILVTLSVFFVRALIQEAYVLFIVVKQKLAIGLFAECYNPFCLAIEDLGSNSQFNQQVQEVIKAISNWIIQRGSDFLMSVPQIVLNLFVIFFTMFYFLKDGDVLMRKLRSFLTAQQQKYGIILSRLKEIVHGVVFGYLLIALIQGALGAFGFFVFGISSPILWGLVMAFLALIPFIGTGLVWVPAALFLLLDGIFQNSNWLIFKGIGLFLFGLIIISGVDNILRPALMGNKAKIHPAIVMLGIFGGIFFFGPLGVIVGPLILSLTVVVIKAYLKKS